VKQSKTFKFPKSKNKDTVKQELVANDFIETIDGKYKTKDNIDLSDNDGEILVPIIMESEDDINGQKIQVDIPEGTIFKDKEQNIYQNILSAPQSLDIGQINNPPANNSIAIMQVGAQDQEIHFENENQDPLLVDITIPLPGRKEGEKIKIFASSDNSKRTLLTETNVLYAEDTQTPYVKFQTPHFTIFYLSTAEYSFFVGNETCTSELAEALYTDIVHLCIT